MGQSVLTICGTYTAEPVAEAVDFWMRYLGIETRVSVAPYAQLFQQLLDPSSGFRDRSSVGNAVLLRWSDLLDSRSGTKQALAWEAVEAQVAELASALQAVEPAAPCLVLAGPEDPADPRADAFRRATSQLNSMLSGQPMLQVEDAGPLMRQYRVDRVHDAAADRFGHVPFTPQANAVLGTRIARWHAALVRRPVKLLALDADHTLWSGVVAEDGIHGVRVADGHADFQRALVRQAEGGRLLCVLSKNRQQDVRQVFDTHPDMALKWSHLTADRIDWDPKPTNLRALVGELELGLDSVVFLDDSPMECAAMRAHCPEVTTVRVPNDPADLARFVDHLWLLDQPPATKEDLGRSRMYADNASRAELRRSVGSLRSFLDGLELVVDIHAPQPGEHARLAQLTQRTNQFNASLVRCREQEVVESAPSAFHRSVRACDRFGDYGIVGQLRGRADGERLLLDLFMLSCRALGRGIEHRMVAAAGAHAVAAGLEDVVVLYREGDRNQPVARFLDSIFGAPAPAGDRSGSYYRMPASVAAAVAFDPDNTANYHGNGGDTLAPAQNPGAANAGRSMAADEFDLGARYEHIAQVMNTGERIQQAIAGRMRQRPELDAGFIAPATGIERQIADIWEEVLRIEPVGVRDRFQDLGGRSLHLVQVHRLLLDRIGVAFDITTLFQHPTVSSLAEWLGASAGADVTDLARQRGQKMRAARERAAQRAGVGS